MGLGKTLTMISLILRQKELDPPPPAHHDLWLSKTVKIKRSDGTLVVCPASVVGKSHIQLPIITSSKENGHELFICENMYWQFFSYNNVQVEKKVNTFVNRKTLEENFSND